MKKQPDGATLVALGIAFGILLAATANAEQALREELRKRFIETMASEALHKVEGKVEQELRVHEGMF